MLQYPNWSIKDATVVERAGVFHVFFDAAYEDDGRIRFHVVEVTTRDFKSYSTPVLNFYGRGDGPGSSWIGMASPEVCEYKGVYYMAFNSWGDKEGQPNQLFYMTSRDLIHWSERRPLAGNLTRGQRAIDAAVAFANGRVYLIHKEKQAARIAVADKIDGDFKWIGDGAPRFRREGGAAANWHENFQFIKLDGQWRMMTTGERHDPFLYRMERGGARDAVRLGLAFVTEDRKEQGLLLPQSIRANITITRLKPLSRLGVIERGRELRTVENLIHVLGVRCQSAEQPAATLSGGNQQKVVIAKWLWREPEVLLFDEPTRGIDVGAKFEIYGLLSDLAARGKAIIVVSSELEELMALCDRIAVMSAGKLVATFARGEWDQDKIMSAAFSEHINRS